MNRQVDPRFLPGRHTIKVVGYAPSGPFHMFGPVCATSRVLEVPGVPMLTPHGGVAFMVPELEWLLEHRALNRHADGIIDLSISWGVTL